MTVAGAAGDSGLASRLSHAMARLHETHHVHRKAVVETCIGRDVVLCTFSVPDATIGQPTTPTDLGFPEGSEQELIDAVQASTSRRVLASLNADHAAPGVAGYVFFLEQEDESPPPRFTVRTEALGGGAIVIVEGDFDRASAPAVEKEVQRQLERRGGRLVLDLSRTTFIDASAIHLMEELSSRAVAAGDLFVAVLACPRARWLLDVAPVREGLQIVGSVEEAMAAWAGPDRRQAPRQPA